MAEAEGGGGHEGENAVQHVKLRFLIRVAGLAGGLEGKGWFARFSSLQTTLAPARNSKMACCGQPAKSGKFRQAAIWRAGSRAGEEGEGLVIACSAAPESSFGQDSEEVATAGAAVGDRTQKFAQRGGDPGGVAGH